MKRNILIISLLLSSVFICFGQKKKKHHSEDPAAKEQTKDTIDYSAIGAPLPYLKVYDKHGRYIYNKDLENDAHLVLMLFNPTCDHCEDQARMFKDNIFLFKKTKLLLIAGDAMMPYMEYFTATTRTEDYPSIRMGVDSSGYIEKTYKQIALPQINIYDKDRKLERIFYGVTPIDTLKQYID